MATTYSEFLDLPLPAVGDTGWGPVLLALFGVLDSLAPANSGYVVPAEEPSASLNVAVRPCVYAKAAGTIGTYAGVASFAVSASTVTYLYLTDAGVLTASTSAFPTGSPIVRLAVVTATGSVIDSILDARVVLRSTS